MPFGHYLGRAFQIQDDLLDVIGDEQEFGKAIGGDILEGKKTYLLLRARERATAGERRVLDDMMRRARHRKAPPSSAGRRRIVERVAALYRKHGVLDEARREVERNTQSALRSLRTLPARSPYHAPLAGRALVHRAS